MPRAQILENLTVALDLMSKSSMNVTAVGNLDRIRLFLVSVYLAGQNLLLALVNLLLFRKVQDHRPRTILVYRTARLGDFIVAIPALAILRRTFPQARIVLLTAASTTQSMQR